MGSYYREHVSYPNVAAGPYPSNPHLVSVPDNVGTNITNVHNAPPALPHESANPKECSVKGCSGMILPGRPHKMCDECRGRHRVYAMTKRAKRKMEKSLINTQNGQPVVWMPPDEAAQQEGSTPSSEPVAGPSRQYQVRLFPHSVSHIIRLRPRPRRRDPVSENGHAPYRGAWMVHCSQISLGAASRVRLRALRLPLFRVYRAQHEYLQWHLFAFRSCELYHTTSSRAREYHLTE